MAYNAKGVKPMTKNKWAKEMKGLGVEGGKQKRVNGRVLTGFVGYKIAHGEMDFLENEEE
jgi:hypothetical protein